MRRALFLPALLLTATSAIAHADPATDLPEQPSRVDVQAAMNAVAPAIAACAGGARGLATLSYEFGNDGRVRSVVVAGGSVGGASISGTPIETCIVAAARTAVLPPFRRETIVVNYPYRL